MTRRTETIDTSFFDGLYTANPDPWSFRASPYEQGKYVDTLAVLQRPRYERALEIGCSIGVFTRLLAERCGMLTAIEPSAPALAEARLACAALPNVMFGSDSLPRSMPAGPFGLIILSEVLYYLDRDDAHAAVRMCCDALAPDGEFILCHWLGETDYPLTGDDAAEVAVGEARHRGWLVRSLRRDAYRLDHIRAASA